MPSLICSSRYTIDSQILRKTAQSLGWETLRLDGNKLPDWFDPPDNEIAFFYTAPHVFDIAQQLGRGMIGCNPDWTVNLPDEFLQRDLRQTTLVEALKTIDGHFVKHSVSKVFPAGIYTAQSLNNETSAIPRNSLVHIGEPVTWTHEYRCFVANGNVMTISPYVYDGVVVRDYDSFPPITEAELLSVRSFAESVLNSPKVEVPDAFVLDVGIIAERGWAVVECNECWASGIYACDPEAVLQTLLHGNMMSELVSSSAWDFAHHYSFACAKPKR